MTNRCEADTERRQRAAADDTVTQDLGNGMQRMVTFQVGYDHRPFPEDCGGGGHGRHGMTLRFILRGPHGAVQWVAYLMNMIPGNVNIMGEVESEHPVSVVAVLDRSLGDAMATDLGYHSLVPQWEGQEEYKRECKLLPEGYCYYDGSSVNAVPVLAAFLQHGPHAVWASLARYYKEVLT